MMQRRTCLELGVCQARPDCTCCAPQAVPACTQHDTAQLPAGDFYFAPGTIERLAPTRRRLGLSPAAVDVIGRAVLIFSACGALAAAIGFASGWLTLRGLL